MMKSLIPIGVLSLLCWFPLHASAQLQPTQIAILANQGSPQSQELAKYYAQKRGVPAKNICVVNIPEGEVLKRADWDKVRSSIRRWISENRLPNTLRCFVTTWDVPLKIDKLATPGVATRRRTRLLKLERERRMERMVKFIGEYDAISRPDDWKSDGVALTVDANSTLEEITAALGSRLRDAETRIKSLDQGSARQRAGITKLTNLSVAIAGLQVVTQNLQRNISEGNGNERMRRELAIGQGRMIGLGEGQSLIDRIPPGPERDTNLIALIERSRGIAGTVEWIDNQLEVLGKNETYSSFDSELSLVMESNYQLLRWQPNYLNYRYDGSPLREITRTLMVSRLEAPTFELSRKLVDTAMATEQQGLQGKVYLDARGIIKLSDPAPRAGADPDFDRSLLLAEQFLKKHTNLEVVVNEGPALFQTGECPDCALYCGWVSLSKYIDAFQWNPGAIGYHMASGEASTLRRTDSQVWCKRMLDEGVTGTLGPVYEPVLLAYPRPNEFFALLVSGKYTYIECVYRTQNTNSWTMATIGDPLYNPFKAKPALTSTPDEYKAILGVE